MSELAISIRDLRKIYRLYAKPSYRLLDVMGLLRRNGGRWSEHAALDGVSLDIRRGEKVAIIGRNGAGKSTLLKLVTGVTSPTSGSIEVHGEAQALLQIGTGFHPDFTGRENARSYLAHVGVVGAKAERRIAEIIEFAELEEYIDQPVKTYSTGMGMRLMFAASTVINPDILVIDEVLGVGDAYFAAKSFERIQDLCDTKGTTLVLVTHDVYAASKLCERMVWIDQGRVLIDSSPGEVMKAYDASIRLQEETRLRLKRQTFPENEIAAGWILIDIELSTLDNRPPTGKVHVEAPTLASGDQILSEPFAFRDTFGGEPIRDAIGLSHEIFVGETPFRTAVFTVLCRDDVAALDSVNLRLNFDVEKAETFKVALYMGKAVIWRGMIQPEPGIATTTAALGRSKPTVSVSHTLGAGRIWIDAVSLIDGSGADRRVFRSDEAMSVLLKCRIAPGIGATAFEPLVAFHKDGSFDVLRLVGQPALVRFSPAEIILSWQGLSLAAGEYALTVMLVKPGYFANANGKFYSLNEDVYCVFNRGLKLKVDSSNSFDTGTFVIGALTTRISE